MSHMAKTPKPMEASSSSIRQDSGSFLAGPVSRCEGFHVSKKAATIITIVGIPSINKTNKQPGM
jgi:hypothetical protein